MAFYLIHKKGMLKTNNLNINDRIFQRHFLLFFFVLL